MHNMKMIHANRIQLLYTYKKLNNFNGAIIEATTDTTFLHTTINKLYHSINVFPK